MRALVHDPNAIGGAIFDAAQQANWNLQTSSSIEKTTSIVARTQFDLVFVCAAKGQRDELRRIAHFIETHSEIDVPVVSCTVSSSVRPVCLLDLQDDDQFDLFLPCAPGEILCMANSVTGRGNCPDFVLRARPSNDLPGATNGCTDQRSRDLPEKTNERSEPEKQSSFLKLVYDADSASKATEEQSWHRSFPHGSVHGHKWMFPVLEDLTSYATEHHLIHVAERLAQCSRDLKRLTMDSMANH